MKWEYRVEEITFEQQISETVRQLNSFGEEEWELAAFVPTRTAQDGQTFVVFKRLIC